MQDLDFFIGIFQGTGATSPALMGNSFPVERKVTGKMDLNGFWLSMRFEDKVTVENPNPITGNWQLGYDLSNKQFIGLWTDNLGRWFEQTSKGWNNNMIVFTGGYQVNNEMITVRDSFEKSEWAMRLIVELKKGTNDWVTFLDIDLQKIASI